MGSLGFSFRLIHSSEEYAYFIHRQYTTDCKVQGSDLKGRSIALYYSPQITVAYMLISLPSRFLPFTVLAEHAGEECRTTTEVTLSFQVDLVLSDAAAISEP